MNVSIVFTDTNDQKTVSDLTFNYTGREYPEFSLIYLNGLYGITQLKGFAETIDLNNGQSKRILIVQESPLYFDGAAWVTSDLSLAQSNTVEEVDTNVHLLDASAGLAFRYITLLAPSGDKSTVPVLTKDFFEIVFDIPEVFESSKTCVYGHVREIGGFPDDAEDIFFTAENEESFFTDGVLINPSKARADVMSSDFYIWDFAFFLYESATAGKKYLFRGHYKQGSVNKSFTLGNAEVPNAIKVNISTLVFS